MKWRYPLITFVLLVVAAVRVAVGVPPTTAPSLTITGQVDIATGTDGRLLVLIDESTAEQEPDGLVEHVFRLQDGPMVVFSGRATATYTRGRLTVQINAQSGWVFTVDGRVLPPPDLALTGYTVTGIAHSWGDTVHQPPATLFSTLSAGTCSQSSFLSRSIGTLSVSGGCTNCQAGGVGNSGCSIDCGSSSCDADCSSESYACCSCPGGCGCCGNGGGGGAHH